MLTKDEILDDMIEIHELDKDAFLKVRETLTRIGFVKQHPGDDKKTLTQQCHVLHSRGRYFICHFKQLFLLDGKEQTTIYTDRDEDALFKTVNLLESWGLVEPLEEIEKVNAHIQTIPYGAKSDYILKSNYTIGAKREQKKSS